MTTTHAPLADLSDDELRRFLQQQQQAYAELKAAGLKLDLTRGKPSAEQLDLSDALLRLPTSTRDRAGVDVRNYGGLEGLAELREIFAELLGVEPSQVVVGGNSSLTMMHTTIVDFLLHGGVDSARPWSQEEKVTFICPVPGYDRHFSLLASLGIEMVTVEMHARRARHGGRGGARQGRPDASRASGSCPRTPTRPAPSCRRRSLRGWRPCRRRPRTSPSSGTTRMRFHHLTEDEAKSADILSLAAASGHPNRPIIFASTSKITFAGAGVAVLAASEANVQWYLEHLSMGSIGPDKVNQLRHVEFFGSAQGVREHMGRHREILAPKFAAVDEALTAELAGLGVAEWSQPTGGYFVNLDVLDGTASRVVDAREGGRYRPHARWGLVPARPRSTGPEHPAGPELSRARRRFAPPWPAWPRASPSPRLRRSLLDRGLRVGTAQRRCHDRHAPRKDHTMSGTEPNENIDDDLTTYSVDDEDQLQPEDTLVSEDVEDALDRGYSPPDSRSRGVTAFGTTPYEQSLEETIDQRILQEEPDPNSAYGAPHNESGLDGEERVGGDDPDAIDAEDDWLGDHEVGDKARRAPRGRRRGRPRGRREGVLGARRGHRRCRRLRRGGCHAHHRETPRARRQVPATSLTGRLRPCQTGAHDSCGGGAAQGAPPPAFHRLDARRDGARPRRPARHPAARRPVGAAGRRSWRRRPTNAAGSASSASTMPPVPACAERRTCAASSARPPRTTPPRAPGGSRSRSTPPPTPPSSAASPRPSRSCSTRPRPCRRRAAIGVGDRRRRQPDATPARGAHAGPPRGPVCRLTARATSWASACPTTSDAASIADFAPAFAHRPPCRPRARPPWRRAARCPVGHGDPGAPRPRPHRPRRALRRGPRRCSTPSPRPGVTLEVCPGSNVALGVYGRPGRCPSRSIVDAGIQVALGADDPLLFGNRLAHAVRTRRATWASATPSSPALARGSLRGSRAPERVRAAALDDVDAWLAVPA